MNALRLHTESIVDFGHRRPWLICACLLMGIGGLLMIVGSSLGVRMFGAWMTLLVMLSGVLGLGLYLSMKLAGPDPTSEEPSSVTNSRAPVVFFSILAAGIASPRALDSIGVFISSLLEALFVATPDLVMKTEDEFPHEITAQKAGLVLSQIFSFIHTQLIASKVSPSSWTYFFIVYATVLLLGRALSRSHSALDRKASDGAESAKNRPILMSYPKWLALCLYCAILVPATYFSLGSLLRLGIDTESKSESISDALAAAAKPDDAPPPPVVSFIGIQKALKTLEPSERSETARLAIAAAQNLRIGETGLEAWQAAYEAGATDQILAFTAAATPNQLADEVVHMTATFRGELNARRAQRRGCLADLAELQHIPTTKTPSRGAVEIARSAQARCAVFADGSRPAATLSEGAIPGIHDQLFGWMAHASESAILIIGMVGFGLFGAAIRMMGSPDQAPVTESELIIARSRAEAYGEAARTAISETKLAQEAVDGAKSALERTPPASSPAEARDALAKAEGVLAMRRAREAAAARDAKQSEQTLRHLERAAFEDRSNFVIEKHVLSPETGEPKIEYVVSGAPAKVLVSGLGAAFTVFLAGKAGAQVFTNGGQTSPTGLLLACFVGAVFAQDIWEAAGRSIKRAPAPQIPGTT